MIDKILNHPALRILGCAMTLFVGVPMIFSGSAPIGARVMGGVFVFTGGLALLREILALLKKKDSPK